MKIFLSHVHALILMNQLMVKFMKFMICNLNDFHGLMDCFDRCELTSMHVTQRRIGALVAQDLKYTSNMQEILPKSNHTSIPLQVEFLIEHLNSDILESKRY